MPTTKRAMKTKGIATPILIFVLDKRLFDKFLGVELFNKLLYLVGCMHLVPFHADVWKGYDSQRA